MNNVEIVKYIYEKFKHGDAPSILTTFAPDVEFRLAEGHPYQPSGQPWLGKDAITQHFFAKAGPEWDWSIALANVHDLGDTVVVEGQVRLQADRQGTRRPDMPRVEVQKRHGQEFPPVRRHGADPGGNDTQLAEVARACVGSRRTTLLNGRTRCLAVA